VENTKEKVEVGRRRRRRSRRRRVHLVDAEQSEELCG
jgi:hypothetical protein